MIAAEEAKVLKEQKKILEERITLLQSLVNAVEEKDAAKTAMYEGQIKNLLEQKATYDDQVKTYEKLLRKEKRKRFWTGSVGMAITALAFYIGLK